jgi:hypothetical protein
MMPLGPNRTPDGVEFVQGLENAINNEIGQGRIVLKHRVYMARPSDLPPSNYTIEISREPNGSYVATCPELPGLLVGAGSEVGALTFAKVVLFRVRSQQKEKGSTPVS